MTTVSPLQMEPDRIVAELVAMSESRFFTPTAQRILARSAELLREYTTPRKLEMVQHHATQAEYAVIGRGLEVQTSRPIVEGDLVTHYVASDGTHCARLDDEFNERFSPA